MMNSSGFRDRELTILKPEDSHRIVVLGDSFTWRVGLDVEESVSRLLESKLNSRTSVDIETVNAADLGSNTVEQLVILEDRTLDYETDMILLIYNLNDIEYTPELSTRVYDEDDAVPVVEIDPGEDLMRFSRNRGLRGLILKHKRRSTLTRFLVPRVGALMRKWDLLDSDEFSWVERIFQGFTEEYPGWSESKDALRGMREIASREGSAFVVAIYPLLIELEDYEGREAHQTLMEFCAEIEIECVDLLEVFEHTNEKSF